MIRCCLGSLLWRQCGWYERNRNRNWALSTYIRIYKLAYNTHIRFTLHFRSMSFRDLFYFAASDKQCTHYGPHRSKNAAFIGISDDEDAAQAIFSSLDVIQRKSPMMPFLLSFPLPSDKSLPVSCCTGWHIMLDQPSRWLKNKNCVLVYAPYTKTQPFFSFQWSNLMCHPILRGWCRKSATLLKKG